MWKRDFNNGRHWLNDSAFSSESNHFWLNSSYIHFTITCQWRQLHSQIAPHLNNLLWWCMDMQMIYLTESISTQTHFTHIAHTLINTAHSQKFRWTKILPNPATLEFTSMLNTGQNIYILPMKTGGNKGEIFLQAKIDNIFPAITVPSLALSQAHSNVL